MSRNNGDGENGIMIFGVRLTQEVSNLQHPPQDTNASGSTRTRKRGVPWTEEEHKMFLLGLLRVGKGQWIRISRDFVKTRTPTQVASHAQKYYLRLHNQNPRRRSSLLDITTDTVMESSAMQREELPGPSVPVGDLPMPHPDNRLPHPNRMAKFFEKRKEKMPPTSR